MSVWCPDDNLTCFDWIPMIFGIYVIWVKIFDGNITASYLMKYGHNGRSCDLGIFGILKSIFKLKPSNLVWFSESFMHFLIDSTACPWLCGFQKLSICILWVKIFQCFMELNISPSVCPSMLHFGRFQWGLRGYIQNVGVQDNSRNYYYYYCYYYYYYYYCYYYHCYYYKTAVWRNPVCHGWLHNGKWRCHSSNRTCPQGDVIVTSWHN